MLGSLRIELRPMKAHFDHYDRQTLRRLDPDVRQVTVNIGGYPVTLDFGCLIIGSVIINEENFSHFLDQESRKKVVEVYKTALARSILQHWRGVKSMGDITVKFSLEDIQSTKEYFLLGKASLGISDNSVEGKGKTPHPI